MDGIFFRISLVDIRVLPLITSSFAVKRAVVSSGKLGSFVRTSFSIATSPVASCSSSNPWVTLASGSVVVDSEDNAVP